MYLMKEILKLIKRKYKDCLRKSFNSVINFVLKNIHLVKIFFLGNN